MNIEPLDFVDDWEGRLDDLTSDICVATDPKYIYVIFEDIVPSDWTGGGQLFGEERPKT